MSKSTKRLIAHAFDQTPTSLKHMSTAIDLFAGAGGLSVGLRDAAFAVLLAVELDPTSAKSYTLNHEGTKMLTKDIRTLSGPAILKEAGLGRGQLDLLTACPPCQGFSTLRTRRKTSRKPDPRDELIFDVLRLVRSMRPRVLLVENVPGLADDARFGAFCAGLHRAGYGHAYRVLNASDYGVPQRRKRLVLVATRGKAVPPGWWEHEPRRSTVRDAIAGLPRAGDSGDPLHDLPERRTDRVIARIRATPRDGGSRTDLPVGAGCACHVRHDGYTDVYGRMAWDKVAPTITSGCHNPSRGRFIHPEEHRAITLREAALLQTFPKDYTFDTSRGKEHVAWQIGNAFPPLLISPIAKAVRREV